ncbi:hypothetical protein Droror1_Dr00000183 [Drosera rotundifolia]
MVRLYETQIDFETRRFRVQGSVAAKRGGNKGEGRAGDEGAGGCDGGGEIWGKEERKQGERARCLNEVSTDLGAGNRNKSVVRVSQDSTLDWCLDTVMFVAVNRGSERRIEARLMEIGRREWVSWGYEK